MNIAIGAVKLYKVAVLVEGSDAFAGREKTRVQKELYILASNLEAACSSALRNAEEDLIARFQGRTQRIPVEISKREALSCEIVADRIDAIDEISNLHVRVEDLMDKSR